ncbi:MAG: hypothetical protein CMJ78_21760 [Planctomycetaceae bacterium]|nr:hypothetical protein [Planctomycetaceae bacterium]
MQDTTKEKPDDAEAGTETKEIASVDIGELSSKHSAVGKFSRALSFIKSLSAEGDLESVLNDSLDGLFEIFGRAEEGVILLVNEHTKNLEVRQTRLPLSRPKGKPKLVSQSVLDNVLYEKKGVLLSLGSRANVFLDDAASGSILRNLDSESMSKSGVKSIMCCPMTVRDDEPIGVVQLASAVDGVFEETDLQILGAVSEVLSLTFANAQLSQELRDRGLEVNHAARLSTVGEFVAGIAHELHQPLGVISNYANGWRRRIEKDDFEKDALIEDLRTIHEQSFRAGKIIGGIRQFVQKRGTEFSWTNINDLVCEAVQLAGLSGQRKSTEVTTNLSSDLPMAKVDRTQITQVILNLLINAFEALAATDCAPRRVSVETRLGEKDSLIVVIKDNGPGIAATIEDRIFEQFFSTKSDGLGIGLPLSRDIIEQHGGRLWLRSSEPESTAFWLRLPTESLEPEAPETTDDDDMPTTVNTYR